MSATIIPYDRRATHRVISDPSALDRINDVDALAQECITLVNNASFQRDRTEVVRTLRRLGSKVVHIRRIAQEGAALLSESMIVDPYSARLVHPDDAA